MSAAAKWAEIITDIVAYEMHHANDGELLSEACDRWVERHPVAARVCIISGGLLLTAHLANLIHPHYDPVSMRFFLWQKLRNFK